MKIVIRTFLFHITCIIIFTMIYYNLKDHFQRHTREDFYMIDYFLLSTTIQAGVGISDIYPISFYGKVFMIMQQIIMIMAHIITLYVFTL